MIIFLLPSFVFNVVFLRFMRVKRLSPSSFGLTVESVGRINRDGSQRWCSQYLTASDSSALIGARTGSRHLRGPPGGCRLNVHPSVASPPRVAIWVAFLLPCFQTCCTCLLVQVWNFSRVFSSDVATSVINIFPALYALITHLFSKVY